MNKKNQKIFISGIAGSGVSAIADFIAEKGHEIYGSDRTFDENPQHPLISVFRTKGINIVRQDGTGIDSSFDLVLFSTAVEDSNPEAIKARDLGIPIKKRPEYLAEITAAFDTIAVAGTSGKSTTAGLLAFLMKRIGLEPNFMGGGRVKQFRSPTNPGNSLTGSSTYLVIEACESDGTIVHYRPKHSIILNLDLDHHPVNETAEMFRTLMNNTADRIVMNADDRYLSKIAGRGAITFSINDHSLYRADAVRLGPFGTDFVLNGTGFRLSIPGEYNLYNALSCIAMLAEIGVPLGEVAGILHEFRGIERRFDIHLNDGKNLVIDDYAHNPHKIISLMRAVSRIRERVCYIFQPHGFGPTRLMKNEYISAFSEHLRDSDHLVLLPIYYAGGTASKDISSSDLAEGIRSRRRSVEVIEDRADILRRTGDFSAYVVCGARDETLSDLARDIARAVQSRL